MQPEVYVLIFRISKDCEVHFFPTLIGVFYFVSEGMGHIDHLQMREDA